ncbi:tail component of prophage CP-933R [Escherichia coli]|uniref:Tail component of prophage CP-933R n=1 Tax=Escherichia coli TaxID=562 RepID=A0A377ECA9_ECOLX|nr:tail component of prophage CP-933R [Escherichia coli]
MSQPVGDLVIDLSLDAVRFDEADEPGKASFFRTGD